MRGPGTVRVHGICIVGTEASLVTVQARFEPADRKRTEVCLTGLPDAVIRESKSRLCAALDENGLHVPQGRLYLHLAPSGLRKTGEALDLPLALGAAAACGHLDARRLQNTLFLGELGIDGRLHDVPGGLPAAEAARKAQLSQVVGPPATAREAACVPGSRVFAASTLAHVVRWTVTGEGLEIVERPQDDDADLEAERAEGEYGIDSIRGHSAAKRALTVAAAGGHGLLLVGPPGTGKTLLARALLRLIPEPELEERLEITRIESALGRWRGRLARRRPFRAPHHSVSLAGLIGGGTPITPGEITLAHCGLLFLDELPEFRREVLEGLRQPLESGEVLIARAGRSLRLPARFQLVTAMNPCPCGYRGHPLRPCRCSNHEVARYRRRISGPLLDRVELRLEVPAPDLKVLSQTTAPGDRESVLRERVRTAVGLARARQGARSNSDLDAEALDEFVPLERAVRELIERAGERRALSARAIQSLRRVARTLADLDAKTRVDARHMAEALLLRAPLLETD